VDAVVAAASLPVPTLANISVEVNGLPVPVQAVTPWQINAFLPQSFAPGPATVTVNFADRMNISHAATIANTAAALATSVTDPYTGTLGAAAFHAGTKVLADTVHPAHAGEILETYGFGLGATTPVVTPGNPAPSAPLAVVSPPAVSVGPLFAKVTFAGLVPGFVGLYQVNVVVPSLPSGLYALRWATIDPAFGPAGYISLK
jgi:adhesin/invasin